MLDLLLSFQLLRPVEPPKAFNVDSALKATPRENKEKTKVRSLSPLESSSTFTDPELNEVYDMLKALGSRRLAPSEKAEVGSPMWEVEQSLQGYEVRKKQFKGVRELMDVPDMGSGERVKVYSDPMDVDVYLLYKDSTLQGGYVVKTIYHTYVGGGKGQTRIVEAFGKR